MLCQRHGQSPSQASFLAGPKFLVLKWVCVDSRLALGPVTSKARRTTFTDYGVYGEGERMQGGPGKNMWDVGAQKGAGGRRGVLFARCGDTSTGGIQVIRSNAPPW